MEKFQNDNHVKKAPFTVPSDYFESFTDEMMAKIQEEEKPQKRKWISLVAPYMGMAAMFTVVFLVAQLIFASLGEYDRVTIPSETVVVEVEENSTKFTPSEEEVVDYLLTQMSSDEVIMAMIE